MKTVHPNKQQPPVSGLNPKSSLHRIGFSLLWGLPILLCVLCTHALGVEIDATWKAGTGNWTDSTLWTYDTGTPGYPNNGGDTFDVIIDKNIGVDSVVTLNTNAAIDSLAISNSFDRLVIGDNRYLTIVQDAGRINSGIIANNGIILLNDSNAGGYAYLNVSGTVDLYGSGSILLSNSIGNVIGGSGHLINHSNYIEGSGHLGYNQIQLTNRSMGYITADQTNPLEIDPNAGGMTNEGILQAVSGATLVLTGNGGGAFDNTGGTIRALAGSTVSLDYSASVTGGTLSTSGDGVIQTSYGRHAYLSDLTNAGTYQTSDNAFTHLSGVINNTGTFSMVGTNAGGVPQLYIDGAVSLSGGGTVAMNDHVDNQIIGTGTLTNVDNTIQGAGQLGYNDAGIINQGLIDANQSNSLIVDPNLSAGLVNTGTMQASTGGTLVLSGSGGGAFDNTGGTIQALAGSTVSLAANASVTGGTLTTSDDGVIQTSSFGNHAFLSDLTNAGTYQTSDNAFTHLSGAINNTGTFSMVGTNAGGVPQLYIDGAVSLSGGGTVAMNDHVDNQIIGTGTLTNVDNTIQGAGQLGYNDAGIINQGLIDANQSNSLIVDPNSSVGLINTGTMQASGGGALVLSGNGTGAFDNTGGTIQALAGSTVSLAANASVSGGTLTTSGDGVIQTSTSSHAYLSDLTNAGTYRTSDNANTHLSGAINNTGTFSMVGTNAGGVPRIYIDGAVSLSGGGTVAMNDHVDNQILGTGTLSNVDNTIQGSGDLGSNDAGIINQGLIDANQTTSLVVDPNSSVGLINTGTMQASGGGALVLTGNGTGAFDNTGGIIRALDGSTVSLQTNASVSGGTLTTSGDGVIQTSTSSHAYLSDLTNAGTYRTSDNANTHLSGDINNTGTFSMVGTNVGGVPRIYIDGAVNLSGGGTVAMNNHMDNQILGPGTLTNVDNTIQGAGYLGSNDAGIINQGLIDANQPNSLIVDPNAADGFLNDTTGIVRGSGGGGLILTGSGGGTFDNQGTVEALNGSHVTYNSSATTVNNVGGDLTGGIWRAVSTGNGATVSIKGAAVSTNNAEIELSGAGSVFQTRNGTGGTFTSLEDSLVLNDTAGTLRVLDNRDYTTTNDFTNSGVVRLGGGTFDANSLTNNATGEIYGHGTLADTVTNHGMVRASGGDLVATIDGQSGTIQIDPGASLTLSGNSDGEYLVHNGDALNLGVYNVTVDKDYTNANWGDGNNFDRRAHVTDTGGQIIGNNAAQNITGDVTGGDTATVTLDLGNVRGGTSKTVNYQIANTGTGADIRGAVQTAANGGNVTDNRLSGAGVTAANFGPIAVGANSGNLGVTFDAATGGELAGQSVAVVSNFDNVATQVIGITGLATSLAQGNATPNDDPVNLGNFHVTGSQPSQNFDVQNTTPDSTYAERLGIGSVATAGNFSADNNLGAGFIGGGATQANAVSAAVNNGGAGVNIGSVTIQYTTNGETIDPSFTTINANAQTINLAATGYNPAVGSVTPAPVVLGNQRIGGSATQSLTVANLAPADGTYTETLSAGFGANTGNATNNGGTVNGIAGGASDSTALQVGVDTSVAGARTGTVTVNLTSNEVNGSGLGNTVLASENVTVSGEVYRLAVGDAASNAISFGNVHLNDTASQNLSISNTAVADGYSESLGVSAAASGNAGVSGATGLIVADGSSSALNVSLDTSVAGNRSGTVDLTYTSDGTGTSGLAAIGAGSEQVEVSGAVYRLAEATIDNAAAFNFGAVHVGDTVTQAISITNSAVVDGFSEALTASFGIASDSRITTNGGNIGLLSAGATDNSSMVVGVNTGSEGILDGTVTINFASDGAGTSGLGITALDSQDLSVMANITASAYNYAAPVINTTQPVEFGKYREGDVVTAQALSITNDAPHDGFSESLNAGVGGTTGGVVASGSFNLLAAQATDDTSITVSIDTTTAGNKNGLATLNFVSDGEGTSGLGQTALPSQTVAVTGSVYRLAEAGVSPNPVVLNARVGDTAEQALSISNNALNDGYSEGLGAAFGGSGGDAYFSGALAGLVAAGATDNSSLVVGLNTGSSGIKSGTVDVNFTSDGTGTSDFSALGIGSERIDIQGKVYAQAVADVDTTPINFGIVHVGDSVSAQAVTVGNTASGALTDVIIGGFGGVTGPFTGNGSLAGVAAGDSDNTSLTVGLNTATAGIYTGVAATVSLKSHNEDMADLHITDEIILLSAQVNQYADPIFQIFSGDGTLTGSDNSYLLDFGTIDLSSGSLLASLVVANDVSGPADLLGGDFTIASSDFGLTGFDAFAGIGAGGVTDLMSISLSDAVVGVFSGTITLNAWGANESGYKGAFEAITLTLSGTIRDGGGPQPIPEPGTIMLLAFGLLVAAGHAAGKGRRK